MQQSKKQLKILKASARSCDTVAAVTLLAHSVALGHPRLSLHRYFVAVLLAAPGLEPFQPFCQAAARRMKPELIIAAAKEAAQQLSHTRFDPTRALAMLSSQAPLANQAPDMRPQ